MGFRKTINFTFTLALRTTLRLWVCENALVTLALHIFRNSLQYHIVGGSLAKSFQIWSHFNIGRPCSLGFSNLEAVNLISGWGCVAIKMCFVKQINTLQTSKHYNIIGRVGWGPRFGGGQLCRELGTAKLLFIINE